MHIVYEHITPEGKRYFGTCTDINKAWEHGLGYINNAAFYEAIQNIGWTNINHIIHNDNMLKAEAEQLCKSLIDAHKTYDEQYGYNDPRLETTLSEATRQLMRAHNPKRLAVEHLTIDGELLGTYDSIKDAQRATGDNYSSIVACLKGRMKTYKGTIWRYK